VRSIANVMRQVFKYAVKWGYLQQNPMADKRIELPRGSTKRLKKPQQLTAAQFFYLLSLLGPREKVAVCFAGWLGPRVSEAFGLQWGDLDLQEGVVTFRRGFVQGRITPLKTEASRTSMALPEDVREALLAWRKLTPYGRDEDWTFASPHTKGRRPYWPGQLWKDHIQPVLEAAGLPNIGWHGFRHSVTAWGKVAGLELQEVKALLRHENILTTSNIYGDVELEAKREMQRRLVRFVSEQAQLQAKAAGGEQYAAILQLQA
jgi:integrase